MTETCFSRLKSDDIITPKTRTCPLGSMVSEPSLIAGPRPSSLLRLYCTWNPTTGVLSFLYFAWGGVPTSSDWYVWHSVQVYQQQSAYHRNDNAHSTAYRQQKRDSWRRAHQPSLRDQQCTWWTTAGRVPNLVAQSTWREQYATYHSYKRLEIFCHWLEPLQHNATQAELTLELQ